MAAASPIKTATLIKEIKNILAGADLNSLSAKAIRKSLEEVLKTDLTDRKKEIDDLVMDLISKSSQEDEDDESDKSSDEEFKSPAKKKMKAKPKKSKSDDSGSDDDLQTSAESKAKSSKANKKQKVTENSDEALAKRLQEEEETSLPRRSAFMKASSKKKTAAPKQKKEGKGHSNSTYSRPCSLSAELAEVVGAPEMPRHSVVKKMWEIARARELFDPTNKRYIICDDQLFKMFGTKRILMFGIMKHLKAHIKDQKDLTK